MELQVIRDNKRLSLSRRLLRDGCKSFAVRGLVFFNYKYFIIAFLKYNWTEYKKTILENIYFGA